MKVQHVIQGTLSLKAWQRRAVRLVMVSAGGILAMTGMHDAITWGQLFSLIVQPVPLLGSIVALCGAILSSGHEPKP